MQTVEAGLHLSGVDSLQASCARPCDKIMLVALESSAGHASGSGYQVLKSCWHGVCDSLKGSANGWPSLHNGRHCSLIALAVHDARADFIVVKLADGMAALEDHLGKHRAAHPGSIPALPCLVTASFAACHGHQAIFCRSSALMLCTWEQPWILRHIHQACRRVRCPTTGA